jgi:hypothetical protein
MKKIMLVLLMVSILVPPSFSALLKEDQTLSVTGNGSVQVEPDVANVRLGVEVSRKTAQEAQAGNAEIMQKVSAAIIKLGIPKEKIQTSGYNIWPEIKYETNQPPKTASYRCSNQINITVEDMAKLPNIIDAGINAGANNVQGIQFSRKDDLDSKKAALDKAVREASAKAQAVALASGLKIKKIQNIVEGGASVFPRPMENFAFKTMAAGGAETPVAPGLIEVRGSVTITYLVE